MVCVRGCHKGRTLWFFKAQVCWFKKATLSYCMSGHALHVCFVFPALFQFMSPMLVSPPVFGNFPFILYTPVPIGHTVSCLSTNQLHLYLLSCSLYSWFPLRVFNFCVLVNHLSVVVSISYLPVFPCFVVLKFILSGSLWLSSFWVSVSFFQLFFNTFCTFLIFPKAFLHCQLHHL